MCTFFKLPLFFFSFPHGSTMTFSFFFFFFHWAILLPFFFFLINLDDCSFFFFLVICYFFVLIRHHSLIKVYEYIYSNLFFSSWHFSTLNQTKKRENKIFSIFLFFHLLTIFYPLIFLLLQPNRSEWSVHSFRLGWMPNLRRWPTENKLLFEVSMSAFPKRSNLILNCMTHISLCKHQIVLCGQYYTFSLSQTVSMMEVTLIGLGMGIFHWVFPSLIPNQLWWVSIL